MKQIIKTVPPEEFIEFCKTPGVTYSSLSGTPKQALRKRLLEDQGYICCYCGCRIFNNGTTHIEHIKCQHHNEKDDLDYNNMLVSCDGGEKDRQKMKKSLHYSHCDAKKRDNTIPISPLDKAVEELLIYFEDGTVKGRNEEGSELIRTLGLDVGYLVNQRKNVIESYDDYSIENLKNELEWVRNKNEGKYEPFCFVIEQYIESLIKDKTDSYELLEIGDTVTV